MPALNFKKQFAPDVESGQKRQTIRAKRKDGRAKAGRLLDGRTHDDLPWVKGKI